MMCHLIASVASAGMPRPAISMRARRSCAIGLPRRAAFNSSLAAALSSLATAGAVELRDGVLDHGVEIAGDGGEPHQLRCLVDILRHAAAFLVHGGKRVLRFGIAGSGGLTEQFGGAREILRKLLALQIQQAEIVGGGGMTELSGGGEQTRGLVRIARAAAALQVEHRQREHGVAIAVLGGKLVPFRRLVIVAAARRTLAHKARRAASWRQDRSAARALVASANAVR